MEDFREGENENLLYERHKYLFQPFFDTNQEKKLKQHEEEIYLYITSFTTFTVFATDGKNASTKFGA